MQSPQLDHLVVVAGALDEGVAWVDKTLGAELQPGGEHPRMGTHNALLRLGAEQYLEVISINPSAPAPNRPRWFELDHTPAGSRPALLTWVARTPDVRAAAEACPIPLGEVEAMSRGSFEWLITVRADGTLPGQGLMPTLIEWRSAARPAALLPDQGCSLRSLEGFHPDWEQLLPALAAVGLEGSIVAMPLGRGEAPYLVAHIETPHGLVALGGPRV